MSRSVAFLLALVALQSFRAEAESVTYPGIGTFTDHDFYDPVHRPFVALPQSPEHIDPTFSLYTHKNVNEEQNLNFNDTTGASYLKTNFDPKHGTKIVVHGFIDNRGFGVWMNEMKTEFLEKDQYNIILVDWSKGNFFPYTQATANTRVVGAMVGILIQNLCKTFNITADSFHLLGHSLGSHIVGYAGKFLKGEVGHITGLDPAGPYYEGIVPEGRLWHTDAKFVEAIHTDANHLIPEFGFGMYETCAHVDIYPNGGRKQPGCDQERIISIIIKGLGEGARRLVACNHQRAVDFYIDSINHNKGTPKGYVCENYDDFKLGKCTDCGPNGSKCAILGPRNLEYKSHVANPKVSQNLRFFMATNSDKPYFKYEYILKVKLDPENINHIMQHGKINLRFFDDDGNTESFEFNHNDEIFHYGHTYIHLLVLDTDPKKVTKIDFEWSHGLNILHSKLYVDSIEVVSLSDSNGKSANTIHYVAEDGQHGITNGKHIVFKPTN